MSEQETQVETPIVSLTENAQRMARHFIAEEGANKVLRVGVTSGGCSGFEYLVELDERGEEDLVQSYDDLTVVIDPVCVPFIKNAVLDYQDTIGHAGFVWTNPNATSDCGCGKSFDADV